MNLVINYFYVGFFMTVQIMLGSQKLGEDEILHWSYPIGFWKTIFNPQQSFEQISIMHIFTKTILTDWLKSKVNVVG